MSALQVAAAFRDAFASDRPDFSVINLANADMVGRTGSIPATITGVQAIDACLGAIVAAVHAASGVCLITADHGNGEQMLTTDGTPSTAHSRNPVPLIVTTSGARPRPVSTLADVAPTVLALLGQEQPPAMTEQSLLEPGRLGARASATATG